MRLWLLPLLCYTVVSSKINTPNLIGYRDEDFIIPAPSSDAETTSMRDLLLDRAITVLREVVAAPPAILALGSIVVLQQIARMFRRSPIKTKQRHAVPIDPPLPHRINQEEEGLKLTEKVQGVSIELENAPEERDYESLYNNLSSQHKDVKERWELLQVELREQKAYWEARVDTQEYQNELAVQKLRQTMIGMLEDEKVKLQQSFHKQAEELRIRLEQNSGS